MKRRIAMLALALLLGLSARAEEVFSAPVDEPPAEVEPFELFAPDATATPEITPAPTAAPQVPATLAPTSQNYPEDKVDFEDEIWKRLTKRWKLADYQAAALLSSIAAESGCCPYNAEHTRDADDRERYAFSAGDGIGFGLCQWTFPERKRALYDFAVSMGGENLVWDFDVQMRFMRGEIDFAALTATANLYEATEWVVLAYERPNQRYRNSWPGTRYAIALRLYERHAGKPYAEPALRFVAATPDGQSASEGVEMDGDGGALVVASNYYWRVSADVDWLDVRSPRADDPAQSEPCRCGYARDGAKMLALAAKRLPPTRDACLRFEIFCGSPVAWTIPVRYTGETLPEHLTALLDGFLDAHADALAALLGGPGRGET